MIQPLHRKLTTSTRCALMLAAPARDWNVFQQIFAEHWDGFTHAHPRYQTAYYNGLVAKMLACGNPDKMGYLDLWLSRKSITWSVLPSVQAHFWASIMASA